MNKFCTKIDIDLECDYEKNIKIPQTITHLWHNIENKISLPQNIIYLYHDTNSKLPINIEYLIMPYRLKHKITLPYSVTHLMVNENIFKLKLHTNVKHLKFQYNFNKFIVIPNHITHLTLGEKFNQKITIPINVTHLTFGVKFNQKIILHKNITHLTLGRDCIIGKKIIKCIKLLPNIIELTIPCYCSEKTIEDKINRHKFNNVKIIYA